MGFRKLLAYRKGFALAMEIFEISRTFPKEEKYSLTDQIVRSSRSVTINLAEGYKKRAYPKHFFTKITDADMENAETLGWLEYALACKYITENQKNDLEQKNSEVGRLLNYMKNNLDKFSQ